MEGIQSDIEQEHVHATRSLRHPRPIRAAGQPVRPRRDDLRRGSRRRRLQRRGVREDPGDLPGPGRELHRHRELLHQRPLGEDPRRLLRRAARAGASTWCWRRSSSPTSSPATPTAAARAASSIIAQLDETLRRLRTDYLDLYWLHNWDRHTPIEETMRTLDDLVRAGKIRYIGFSNTPAWVTAQAQTMALLQGWTPLIALQVEYSLLARTVEGETRAARARPGHGAGAVEPAEERVPVRQVPARQPRSPTPPAPPSSADPARTSSTSSTPSPRSPTSSERPRRRCRWPGCAPGPAPSCRSSAPGGWSTSRATSPAWTWPSTPSNSAAWTRSPRRP